MSRLSILALPLVLASSCLACEYPGEDQQIRFELPELADALLEFRSGDRIVVGSRLCPRLSSVWSESFGEWVHIAPDDADDYRTCFVESITGSGHLDAQGCLHFDEPGEVVWQLTPALQCGLDGDRLRFDVAPVGPTLRLGFDDWRERHAILLTDDEPPLHLRGLDEGLTIADLREPPDAPRRVIAGEVDAVMLRFDDDAGRVFSTDAVELEVFGDGVTEVSGAEAFITEKWLSLESGSVGRIRARLPDGSTRDSPQLVAVPSSEAASLELVVAVRDERPLYARALIRDREGRPLHGAPVEWRVVEGALWVEPGNLENEARTADYALIGGECLPPEEQPVMRRAVLQARHAELADEVEIEWVEQPPEPEDRGAPFEPSSDCQFGADLDDGGADHGCGCTSASSGSHLATLPMLALLLVLRRRREVA